ncbi:MAG: glycosyltransferase family 4 protein [Thermoplasmata archaeon]
MRVEIITFDADPDRGGFGTRVHSIASMFAQSAEVNVVRTSWFEGPEIPGVRYEDVPLKDGLRSRLRRLRTYYKTDFPRRQAREPPTFTIVESPDLVGLHQYGDDTPLVLDEHNVYWDLLRHEMVNAPFFRTWPGRSRLVQRWLIPRLLKRARAFEQGVLRRATRTLVTSEADRSRILQELPELEARVRVLPNCIDLAGIPIAQGGVEAATVLFVGNYNFIPNREAAVFISQTLAPSLPEAKFVLVGADPPTEAVQAENVSAPGYVKDLQGVLATANVCIAPLEHGSGTRLKILTYLAAGKAVVATTKACEGLEVQDGVHLLIRDDAEAFSAAVRQILADSALQRRLGSEGRKLVETKYDWRVYVGWAREFAVEVQEAAGRPGAS